jgi:hypothetical protein
MLAASALGGSTAVKGQLLRELLVESKAYGERAYESVYSSPGGTDGQRVSPEGTARLAAGRHFKPAKQILYTRVRCLLPDTRKLGPFPKGSHAGRATKKLARGSGLWGKHCGGAREGVAVQCSGGEGAGARRCA